MSSPLTRSGYPNTRNLDKKFRPVRLNKDDSIYWSDNLGSGVKPTVTTGCFGSRSTFAVRAKKFGPQVGRRVERKKKHGCRLLSTDQINKSSERTIDDLIQLRGRILRLRLIGDLYNRDFLSPNIQRCLTKLSSIIFLNTNAVVVAKVKELDSQNECILKSKFYNRNNSGKNVKKLIRSINIDINTIKDLV